MVISTQCDKCSHSFSAPAERLGDNVQCPNCKATTLCLETRPENPAPLADPTRASKIPVECSGCKAKIRVPIAHAGKRVKCPRCATTIQCPATQTLAPDQGLLQTKPDRHADQRTTPLPPSHSRGTRGSGEATKTPDSKSPSLAPKPSAESPPLQIPSGHFAVTCSGCNGQFQIADEHAGQTAFCPTCGTTIHGEAPVQATLVSSATPAIDDSFDDLLQDSELDLGDDLFDEPDMDATETSGRSRRNKEPIPNPLETILSSIEFTDGTPILALATAVLAIAVWYHNPGHHVWNAASPDAFAFVFKFLPRMGLIIAGITFAVSVFGRDSFWGILDRWPAALFMYAMAVWLGLIITKSDGLNAALIICGLIVFIGALFHRYGVSIIGSVLCCLMAIFVFARVPPTTNAQPNRGSQSAPAISTEHRSQRSPPTARH